MPRKKTELAGFDHSNVPTATTPEGRENQLIAMAYDLAEKRLREGTASAQEVTHFLKMGSMKERMEREMLAEQKKLLTAKTESLESSKRVEDLYSKALSAMREYSGAGVDEDYDYDH